MSGVTVPTMMASISVGVEVRADAALSVKPQRRDRWLRLPCLDDVALANADAAHDPFVVGVDHRSRSALVRSRGGTYVPKALILARIGLFNQVP